MRKELLKILSQNKLFAASILFLLVPHFLFLRTFPIGFNHDEIEKVLSIRSFIERGRDISNIPFPQALILSNTSGGQNNLIPLLLSIVFRIFPLNTTTIRIPFVLVSLMTWGLLSRLIWKLTRNRPLSQVMLLVALMNPWVWYLSRSITEATFALFFVILGVWMLENNSKRIQQLSVVSFVLGFLSYWGITVVLPIVVALCLIVRSCIIEKKEKKVGLLPIVTWVVFIFAFLILLFQTTENTFKRRSGELIIKNLSRYSEEVNVRRAASIESAVTPLLINKFTLLARDISKKYVSILSPSYLFFNGDPRATYSFGEWGMFHLVDGLFALFGVVLLAKLKLNAQIKRFLTYGIVFIVLGPLASSLNRIEDSYVFRSVLTLPVFIVLISAGIVYLSAKARFTKYVLAGVLFMSFIRFLSFYFFEFPVKSQENQFWAESVVAEYVQRLPSNQKVTVVTSYPTQVALKYLLSRQDTLSISLMKTLYSPPILIGNVTFTSQCNAVEGTVIVQEGISCTLPMTSDAQAVIENYADSGSLWKIYNDVECAALPLSSYRSAHRVRDYNLQDLNNETFCLRQIHRYD